MMLRSYVFLLIGIVFVAMGLVVFGVRFLDGMALPNFALAAATLALAIGIPCLEMARKEATKHSKWRFTSTGIVVFSVFAALFGADLVFSVICFPNPKRGDVFYSLAAVLIILVAVVEKILARLGKPLVEGNSE